MTPVHAVIIAGGKGERLGGVRKAALRVGGVPLLERVIGALGAVEAPVLISTGPGDWDGGVPDGCLLLRDLTAPCAGPLAGVAAAIAALRRREITSGVMISVAVDTPFLPDDFTARLRAAIDSAPAAYAAWGEDFYPPNAAWRIEAIADLPERITAPTPPKSLKALQRMIGAAAVDWSARGATNPFANLNTVGDLVALGRRARDSGEIW